MFAVTVILRNSEIHPFNLNQVIARGVGSSIYNTDQFVLTALYTCAVLLKKFVSIYQNVPSSPQLFTQARTALHQIDATDYPEKLGVRKALILCVKQCILFVKLCDICNLPVFQSMTS